MDEYHSIYTGPQIDKAIGTLREKESAWDGKQNQLTGEPGQVLGFDEQGRPLPQEEGVPQDRTVNGKPLREDIDLTAEDVGAAEAEHTHTAEDVGAAAASHIHTAEDVGAAPASHTHTAEDVGAASAGHTHTAEDVGAVPFTRAVNGKVLSKDITLTPEDVGAAPVDHTHTSDGLSQDSADTRYLKLSGGALTGPVTVQEPEEAAHPATRGYVDGRSAFCKTFAAADWSSSGTISIPQSEHGKSFPGGVVVLDAYMLVSGAYIKTWAAQTTYAVLESDKTLTLHFPGAENGAGGYAGKIIVIG